MKQSHMIEHIRSFSRPLHSSSDLDAVLHSIGDAKYVLLGEASHGTSEFYTLRTELTKRLVEEKHFSFVIVEGDWPSCQYVNRYIKGYEGAASDIKEAMQGFQRWPRWMWANKEAMDLVAWLKTYNEANEKKVGFYGFDVYSLWESMDEVVRYLEKTGSPDLAAAKQAFSCFEPFQRNEQSYAVSSALLSEGCTDEVMELFMTIQKHRNRYDSKEEERLNLEINALAAANAEHYYRTMVKSDNESWNIRDHHMVQVLNKVMNYHDEGAKAIIWAHNTHVGDARATDMKKEGLVNVGQLVREQHGEENVYIVGFGTYQGTVIAAEEWGVHWEEVRVPPAKADSWEYMMHEAGAQNQLLIFDESNRDFFNEYIGHRAIGVVFNPKYERYNYVPSLMPKRYNAFIHVEGTDALSPLELHPVLL